MKYRVIIEKGPKSYGAYVPDLPGCIAVGTSRREVQKLVEKAIDFHIEGLRLEGARVPPPRTQLRGRRK